MIEVITKEDFYLLLHRFDSLEQRLFNNTKNSKLQIIDNNEAAQLLGVTKRTLQTYRDTGKISFIQEGSKIWYRLSDIEEFLNVRYNKSFVKIKKVL